MPMNSGWWNEHYKPNLKQASEKLAVYDDTHHFSLNEFKKRVSVREQKLLVRRLASSATS